MGLGTWLAGLDEPPKAVVAVLRDAMQDENPLVRGHAAWVLEQTPGSGTTARHG